MMVAALVIIGATACTESEEGVDKKQEQSAGVSFYATIGDDTTRAYIDNADGDKTWSTVWEEGDTLVVRDDTYVYYTFVCTDAATGKFTCSDSGAVTLVGNEVTIRNDYDKHKCDSRLGKKALSVWTTGVEFTPDATIQLSSETSFFRYTYEGEGDVTLKLTLKSQMGDDVNAFRDNGNFVDEITFSGIKGENFVPFWCGIVSPEQGVNATLSYAIDGVIVKQTTIKNISAGKVYNLGELGLPYETSAYSVVGTHNNWTAGQTPMYIIGDYAVAYGVEFTGASNAFKVLGNDKWLGAASLSLGAWTSLTVDTADMTLPAGKYDFYFSEARTMLCVVEAGVVAPELAEIEWALAGDFNNWGDTSMAKTDVANLFVAKGVELTTGTAIKVKDAATWDTSYGGGINNLEPNKWMTVYSNGADIVIAKSGAYDVYFQYGATPKLYLIEADGDYTAATEQTANGTLVPDEVETPEEVTPGVASEWALVGAFSSWVDKTMLTTTDANIVVLQNVAIKAAEGFLVRKPATEWADKHGAGNVNYIKANHYITSVKDGADMCLEADGTYDVYFNISTKNVYVMVAGVDYATATHQTVNGEEPKQEEPEVTEKVVYLKPNSNWTQSNARFAAYFWNDGGNVWVSMTAVGDGTYVVHLPEGYDYGCNVIFCRMNPATTANNWNNKWNQTSDLKTPTDGKNLYTVANGTWDKGGGTWSVK